MQKVTRAGFEAQIETMVYWVGLLSLAAGLVHGIATWQYWDNWWGYAIFFLSVALAQAAYGLLLFFQPWRYDETGGIRESSLKQARPSFMIGAVGNGSIILLWLVTRTLGVPFLGPRAGQTEPLTLLSVVATLIELAIVLYLVRWIRLIDREP